MERFISLLTACWIREADPRDHGGMGRLESLDEAEKVAKGNPFIASIRVYESRSMSM